ncbi:MFS transporter [Brevibacterium album]|uniref:MFS transporter n=1 Tax=Brevibacterium album TaxID=417948 RepID=UPI000420BA1C|nr:MFS transporter [Brevibacterium album]
MREAKAGLWTLVLAAVLTQTGLNLFRPVTSYKLLDLGADPVLIGFVTAAYALLPLVIALPLGRLADRTLRLRHIMALGALLLAAGGALMAGTASVALVFIGSVLLGLGHLLFTIAGQTSIARFVPPEHLDRGFGYFTAAFSVGQLIGPLLAGAVLGGHAHAEQIALALWMGAGSAALAVVLLAAAAAVRSRRARGGGGAEAPGAVNGGEAAEAETDPEADAASAETAASPGRPSARAVLRVPGVRSQIFASLALLVMIDLLTAYLPLVGEHAGVAPATIGLLLAARSLASIASRVLLEPLARRFSRNTLVTASALGAGVALALPPLLMDHLWAAAVLMLLGGFFLGLGQPLSMSLVTQAVPASWRGTALATRLMGNRLGQVAFPAGAGLLAAPLGAAGPIWFSCAMLVGSGVELLARAARRR